MPSAACASALAAQGEANPTVLRASEAQLHRAVAEYLAAVLTSHSWFTTFPAGGGGKTRGARLKAIGLKPGVPDLLIVFAGRLHAIELKAAKGKLSEAQEYTLYDLDAAGAATAVARSIDDVRFHLKRWQIPLREVGA